MQQAKVLETWVGLFVALGIVALFFMAMQVSNLGDIRSDEKNYRITARFANAGSLRVRAPVSMAGVRLGRVEGIHFDKDSYEAVVDMRIEARYDTIPDDTSASILTQGLLGEQYIGLSAGGSSEYLGDGDEIDLTQSALVLEEVISRFLFNKAESSEDKKVAAGESAPADKPEEDMELRAAPAPEPVKAEVKESKEETKPKAPPEKGVVPKVSVKPHPEARPVAPGHPEAKAFTPSRHATPAPAAGKKGPTQ